MKKIFFSLTILTLATYISCKNGSSNGQDGPGARHDSLNQAKMKMDNMKMDTMNNMKMDSANDMKKMKHDSISSMLDMDKHSMENVDASVSKYIRNIMLGYLDVKNSLVSDNAINAARGAKRLLGTIKNFDKSLFPAEQKKEYDKYSDAIKEQSHSVAGSNDIEIQRAAFSQLSDNLYALLKSFGSSQMLYRYHCPMALNNKGGMWLSETKEIHNPYLGIKMITCGKLEGMIE